jgi:methylmalonyl-CoA mutase
LTHELCGAAWSLFQEMEQAGGAAAALEQGLIQAMVAAVRAARETAIAQRKDALTGTSEFPDIAEMPVEALHAALPLTSPSPQEGAERKAFSRLPCLRLAEPFEALRDASDRVVERTGARPKVFLANLGNVADFTARATYAKNFFETAGIAAVTNDGFASNEEVLSSFNASGASLACLCSSDAVYGAEAATVASALREAGARHVYLAGRPGELEPMLRAAGVGTFIHVGCNLLATLTAAHEILNLGH